MNAYAANELKPLLHTWSLAVEEQYYMFFPLFLIAMWRFNKRWILGSFIFFALLSFSVSHWAASNFPVANFFLLPTRAWELAIGACISFYFIYRVHFYNVLSNNTFNEIFGFIGLFLIGYSIFFFDEDILFPSVYALVPTIGTALIILFSSQKTFLGRVLGSKIPVGIGLISYSAYLWHQPLFSFARHRSLTEPSESFFLLLFVLTFILALFSWQFIEKPFRIKGVVSRKKVFLLATLGSFFFISVGVAGHLTDGFNGFARSARITQEVIELKWKANHGLSKECSKISPEHNECTTGPKPTILIWGDSFAMHLVNGVIASNPDVEIIQKTRSDCGPFFDIAPIDYRLTKSWAKKCLNFNDEVRKFLNRNKTVKYVILSSPFTAYLSDDNKLLTKDGRVVKVDREYVVSEFNNTLKDILSMGIKPIIFSPPPANGNDIGRCLAKAEWMNLSRSECDFSLSDLTKEISDAYKFLENFSSEYTMIKLEDLICEDSLCRSHIDNTWLYRDEGHLSITGSVLLGEKFDFYTKIVGEK